MPCAVVVSVSPSHKDINLGSGLSRSAADTDSSKLPSMISVPDNYDCCSCLNHRIMVYDFKCFIY